MKNLRKWLLCVIAAVSLTVTACEGDSAAKASVAADVAHAAGNILESLAEAAENSGAGNSGDREINVIGDGRKRVDDRRIPSL